jgi:P pilus assembly chaperone PapD
MLSSSLVFTQLYRVFLCLIVICLTSVLCPQKAESAGGLRVAPTLVELDNRQKTQTLHVINGGSETHTYRISLVNYRMDENGGMHETDKPFGQDLFADKLIRFSPRQVTLEPGESQTVRVLYRRSANMAKGEYRSHLLFRQLPKSKPLSSDQGDTSKLKINISAIFGISIPVIIRHGELSAKGEITDLALGMSKDGQPELSMHINRSGNRTLRGNLVVTADNEPVGRINNLAVYLSTPYRRIVLPLTFSESLIGKKIVVEYSEVKKEGGHEIAQYETVFR